MRSGILLLGLSGTASAVNVVQTQQQHQELPGSSQELRPLVWKRTLTTIGVHSDTRFPITKGMMWGRRHLV